MTDPPSPPRAHERIAAAYRRRALAGDERAGSWERGQARRRWYAFVRDRWRLLSSMTLTAALPIAVLAIFVHDPFFRGLIVGAGAIAVVAVLCNLVVQATGTSVLTAGATAEQWTAQELRPLAKHGYRLVNRVLVGMGDTDHVVVGPAGVLVIETKWTSHTWTFEQRNDYRDQAIAQAEDRAGRLARWSHYRRLNAPTPRAVLFLWSPYGTVASEAELGARLQVDDRHTAVWGRKAAAEWRRRVIGAPTVLSDDEVETVTRALVEQTDRQEAAVDEANRPPVSAFRFYWSLVLAVLAFLGAAVIALNAVTHLHTPGWSTVLLAQSAVGAMAARFRPVRIPAVAWLLGSAAVAALAAVTAVISALR